jgi:hypothetical protein
MNLGVLLNNADRAGAPLRYTLDGWSSTHELATASASMPVAVARNAPVRWQPGFCVRASRETPGAYRVELYDLVRGRDGYQPVCTLRIKVRADGALAEPGDEYNSKTSKYATLVPGKDEHGARVTSHLRWIGCMLDYEQRRQRQTTLVVRV